MLFRSLVHDHTRETGVARLKAGMAPTASPTFFDSPIGFECPGVRESLLRNKHPARFEVDKRRVSPVQTTIIGSKLIIHIAAYVKKDFSIIGNQ